MRKVNCKLIEECVYKLALKACVSITPNCKNALENALKNETGKQCEFALETLIQNNEIAKKMNIPVCQDTGVATVFLEIGQNVFLEGKNLADAVNDGVKRAYRDGLFRNSVCDPITRVNTGNNTPAVIHSEIVAGEKIGITFMPKGFGSENMSKIYMLKPSQGTCGIIDAIVETVKIAGSRPCPPVYLGVGIGGTFEYCAYLAKKALTREIGSRNERSEIAEIERQALKKINELKIGCQGFHGETTALGVSCEYAPTHIAGLPVAVNVQCHCVRCEKGEI